jgi:hypothetical protein
MLEMIFAGTLVTGVIAYVRWLDRQEEKSGRKRGYDSGGDYVGDTGGPSWFGGSDSGWGGGDCGGGDGGGCGGGGGD